MDFSEFEHLRAKAEQGKASDAELAMLEPYRVRRAVVLASGLGSRMAPITINTPKPLVRVGGVRIIDTILDAFYKAGITEIHIVRGYLGEQFDQLLAKYPTVTFIDNPLFREANNISSAFLARDFFCNAYVTEADFFLGNPWFVQKYQYDSNYIGIPVQSTSDWCFSTAEGYVTDLKKGGAGDGCHHMFAFSHWTEQDGRKLAEDIAAAYADVENRQRFWDDVPCVLRRDDYRVRVRACAPGDVLEIDSFDELCAADPSYRPKGWAPADALGAAGESGCGKRRASDE